MYNLLKDKRFYDQMYEEEKNSVNSVHFNRFHRIDFRAIGIGMETSSYVNKYFEITNKCIMILSIVFDLYTYT